MNKTSKRKPQTELTVLYELLPINKTIHCTVIPLLTTTLTIACVLVTPNSIVQCNVVGFREDHLINSNGTDDLK